ncbi:malate dehydrogenase [Chloroflexota bacterium]
MKITILGAAGCIGSCATFNIAVHGLADEIVMIGGRQQNKLMHHAMDIGTAVAAQNVTVRSGRYEDMSGSDIVINAAGIHEDLYSSRHTERLPQNLPITQDIAQNINQHCPEAVVITATNPIGPLNYAMYLLGSHRDRSKVIGYSLNDSIRFRMVMARALGVETSQVEGAAIGEHGSTQVLLFSSIRVKDKPVSISEDIKQKIRIDVPDIIRSYEELKVERTTGWTSAVGLAAIIHAIGKNTGEMIPCSTVLDGEYGCRGLSMTVPAIIGRGGIQEVLEWELAPDEQERLEHSINTLKPAMHYVEEYLGRS